MADFTVPLGDPDTLRAVSKKALTTSTDLGGTRRGALDRANKVVAGALPTMRVSDYDGAASSSTKTLDSVALSLGTVGGALSSYAEALDTAQRTVKAARSAYDTAEQKWRTAKQAGETAEAERFRREMTAQETNASNAHDDLRDRADSARTVLSGELHVWVPNGASTPEQAWAGASNGILPPNLRIPPASLKDAWEKGKPIKDAVANTVKTGLKAWQAKNLTDWLRSGSIAAKAEEEFAKSAAAYQLLKGSSPDLSDAKVYKQYMKLEKGMLKDFGKRYPADAIRAQKEYGFLRGLVGDSKAMSRLKALYPALEESAIAGKAGRLAQLMGPLRAVGPWVGKVLAPVSIVTGGLDVYSAITDGSLPTDTRVARGLGGAGGIAAGGATLLVMAGLVSNPVGWAIIIGGSAVALGAWAYENREAIWNGMKWTGGKIADGATWAGDKIADGATSLAHGAAELGSGAEHVAGKVWHGLFG